MTQQEDHLLPAKPRHRWILSLVLGLVLIGSGFIIGSGVTLRLLWRNAIESPQNSEQFAHVAAKRLQIADDRHVAVPASHQRLNLGVTHTARLGTYGVVRQRRIVGRRLPQTRQFADRRLRGRVVVKPQQNRDVAQQRLAGDALVM